MRIRKIAGRRNSKSVAAIWNCLVGESIIAVLVICALLFAGCTPANNSPTNTAPANNVKDDTGATSAPALTEAGVDEGAGDAAAESDGDEKVKDAEKITTVPELSGIGKMNYPDIDGSTANLPLLIALYSAVCGVSPEDAETEVITNGTQSAWDGIIEGDSDMIIAYEPEPDVFEIAKSTAGIKIDSLGRDGLVFLTGKDNPVDSLTQDQLRGIYSGKIKNWSDVGGNDEPIAAFQRNEGSGSQTMFEKLVMKGAKPMKAPAEYVPGEMGSLIESVANFDGEGFSIGYSVFYYADMMYNAPGIKMLAVDKVKPSSETIADKSYPLTNDFYIALSPKTESKNNSPAKKIRNFLLSNKGKEFIKQSNYIPAQ